MSQYTFIKQLYESTKEPYAKHVLRNLLKKWERRLHGATA